MVISEDIVRVSDPERSWGGISIQETVRSSGEQSQVMFEEVMSLNGIFNEESMTLSVISHILSNSQVVDTMDGASSVVSLMDSVTLDVGIVDITNQVVMDRVSTKLEGLTDIL